MDYWGECIAEAFEDAEISATQDQIDTVASWAEGAHDNFSQATGLDVANQNFISEEKRELDRLRGEIKKQEDWELSTKPCKDCTTTGSVLDGYGRNQRCSWCDGKGRV